ncbi:hypothetical protein EAI_06732 [Harpegnathos saltator]|uniref:Double jelly roll-like domain-containing protein n=1 Tax=Harpegnathos saltator TaxID=610380 RepID=E2BXQ6_HARSA|nr:hypothetical protein EAI_06732 [Harpegnathos saltator]
MFDEIRYELDSVEIDRNRNVGITSTLKNYVSLSSNKNVIMKNAAWETTDTISPDGYFNFCVPLRVGFCEDYKRIVINARHELILLRSRSDNNSLLGSSALDPKLT